MKYTLKDYQEEAVQEVLINLFKAKKRLKEDGDKHAFSLTAPTGAGKTVMAASVLESLFFGNEDYDFEADQNAVVIWFSDDPSLNEQTRFRLKQASDKLDNDSNLIVVQNFFNQERFDPGKIYFLNTQKLGKKSLLVRGSAEPGDDDLEGTFPEMQSELRELPPDGRQFTIWDTITNTIEDGNLNLYLVLDEAHKGMGKSETGRSTIVKRLINGSGTTPGMPIVLGISATVERFNEAMKGSKNRSILPDVTVDSDKVQDSGLLKDTIMLDIPDEKGSFDTVLLRRGTQKFKDCCSAWEEYSESQESASLVAPLMVLQVPNKPEPSDISRWLDTIFAEWTDLNEDMVVHVFGEHTTQTFGRYSIPYMSPELIQDASWVRIVIAKDAISTGWDCPRAEVMVSFRAAKDPTHITQLLGRMLRTPLARRIPGHDRLNAVDCLLPFFDNKSVNAVADSLMTGEGAEGGFELRRILINPEEMNCNECISDKVWEKFLSLPSKALPKRGAKPIKRLTSFAHELAADGIVADAGKKAHSEMHKVFEAANKRYEDEIASARQNVLTVEGSTVIVGLKENDKSFDEFLEDSDFAVIEEAYRRSCRIFSSDLSKTYSEFLADKSDEDEEDALLDAHVTIAAMGLVPDIGEFVENEADKLSNKWFTKHRVAIKRLSDERQDVYRQLKGWSSDPQEIDLSKPESWMEATHERLIDGTEKPLPMYEKHLLCNDGGLFPGDFNNWEKLILEREMTRSDFLAWYRNPSRSTQESLGIVYDNGERIKILRPDFLFFRTDDKDQVVADLIDPHGSQLADALPKLKGFACYAEEYGNLFGRIESTSMVKDKMRVLDLTDPKVREGIMGATTNADSLYASDLASDYV